MTVTLDSDYWPQIANGTKVEEYRICSEYYGSRIGRVMKKITAMHFHNRHGKHMTVKVLGVARKPTQDVKNQAWVKQQRVYCVKNHGHMPTHAFVVSLGRVIN